MSTAMFAAITAPSTANVKPKDFLRGKQKIITIKFVTTGMMGKIVVVISFIHIALSGCIFPAAKRRGRVCFVSRREAAGEVTFRGEGSM
jgi:hypothetical protein